VKLFTDVLVPGDFYLLYSSLAKDAAPPGIYRYVRFCPALPPKRGSQPPIRRAWMASMNPNDEGREYAVRIKAQVGQRLGSTPEEVAFWLNHFHTGDGM
jgi:hypothetical protein